MKRPIGVGDVVEVSTGKGISDFIRGEVVAVPGDCESGYNPDYHIIDESNGQPVVLRNFKYLIRCKR